LIPFKEKGLNIELIYKNEEVNEVTEKVLILSVSTSESVSQTKSWNVRFE